MADDPCEAPAAASIYVSPSESFLLPEEDKLNWLVSNAFFLRKNSAKSSDNSLSGTSILTPYSLRLRPRSADFESRGSSSSIIGLPKLRRLSKKDPQRKTGLRLFPRPGGSTSNEPCSPTVTCIGRVRSRRGQSRVLHPEEEVRGTRRPRTTWLARLESLFLLGCKGRHAADTVVRTEPGDARDVDSVPKRDWHKGRGTAMDLKPEPPCLAGTKRIASGRRSASWGNNDYA